MRKHLLRYVLVAVLGGICGAGIYSARRWLLENPLPNVSCGIVTPQMPTAEIDRIIRACPEGTVYFISGVYIEETQR